MPDGDMRQDGTFGNLGLGWSPHISLWLPIITPIADNLPRQMAYGDAKFNQAWMIMDSLFDRDHYGARPLIEAINTNLDGPDEPGISHVFFGHDDVSSTSQWIRENQGGRVFPVAARQEWPHTNRGR